MRAFRSPYWLLVLACLLWGGNYVIGRGISQQLPPFSLAFLRWVIAFLVFLPFAWRQVWDEREILIKHWKVILLMGITGVASFNTLIYMALQHTTAINASVVSGVSPLAIALVSWLVLGETARWNHHLGGGFSLLGVAVIISKGSLAILMDLQVNPGDVLVILAVFVWAIYSVTVKLYIKKISLNASFLTAIAVGLVILLPLFIWDLATYPVVVFSPASIASYLYLGIFASVVSFMAWNSALTRIDPGKAGIFLNLTPVFSTILAVMFLKETLYWFQLLGGSLVITGVYISTIKKASVIGGDR